jgi:hypothetical protein
MDERRDEFTEIARIVELPFRICESMLSGKSIIILYLQNIRKSARDYKFSLVPMRKYRMGTAKFPDWK